MITVVACGFLSSSIRKSMQKRSILIHHTKQLYQSAERCDCDNGSIKKQTKYNGVVRALKLLTRLLTRWYDQQSVRIIARLLAMFGKANRTRTNFLSILEAIFSFQKTIQFEFYFYLILWMDCCEIVHVSIFPGSFFPFSIQSAFVLYILPGPVFLRSESNHSYYQPLRWFIQKVISLASLLIVEALVVRMEKASFSRSNSSKPVLRLPISSQVPKLPEGSSPIWIWFHQGSLSDLFFGCGG